jgi:DNA repair photolyase
VSANQQLDESLEGDYKEQMMPLTNTDVQEGLALAARVDEKYKPVWEPLDPREAAALALYFLPHRSAKPVLSPTRPRILKWYCPFADQRHFPTGHRYCINVFTGCLHDCEYCYAKAYEPHQARCKRDFTRALRRDLAELEAYDVPAAPLHLSNSTDPFQALEVEAGNTLFTLGQILQYRKRFTSVVILTKNPSLAAGPPYLAILQQLNELPVAHGRRGVFAREGLPGLRVEVSLAFWRDEVRATLDPGAPPVQERLAGIRQLRQAGIPVVLRIDPLLPRSPIAGKTLQDFQLPEFQPLEDLDRLLAFGAEVGVMHVVYSVAKIVRPRPAGLSPVMRSLRQVYEHLTTPNRLVFRGGSWRLPDMVARQHVVQPFLELCRRHALTPQFCKQNLIATP